MYRRNKEEVEGLQNKRKQVCNDDQLSLALCVIGLKLTCTCRLRVKYIL
jgi:hypothetical protein